ncbi:MAG: OmpA family protein [Phycisphaerae bacterium]|nr:OmpA family protein [Gemmatimonadaceae bacterium]
MPRLSRYAVLFVALPLALGACKKKPPVVAVVPPVQEPPRADPPRVMPTDNTPVRPTGPDAAEIARRARELMLEIVYFEYDTDAIRADAQASLEKKLPVLQANPGLKFRVEGHCDDRGSDEYNIALGRRRAEAVKRFLTDRGVDASRIETVSFGRERPAMQGDSEEARSRNRRDEFTITAGGENLKMP